MLGKANRAALALSVSGAVAISLVATAAASPAPHPTLAKARTVAAQKGPIPTATWRLPDAPVRMVINTQGGKPIISRDNYINGTVSVGGVTSPMEIKGRGHSTWKWPTAKKPYKFKMTTAKSFLGMPASTEWVLLANFSDRSLLRNYLAYNLARRISANWQPKTRFVNLVLNGSRRGNYLFTEQVMKSPTRVNLPANGYLLEVNQRFANEGDVGYFTRHKIPVAFADPDAPTAAQIAQVKGETRRFEKALYSPTFKNPTTGYRKFINRPSFVDWYIVQELFKNTDGDFQSSDYFTWVPGGKLTMGPQWDFDLSAGTNNNNTGPTLASPYGWWIHGTAQSTHPSHNNHWINRMFKDPSFVRAVRARWNQVFPLIKVMVRRIQGMGTALGASARFDFQRWHTSGWQVPGTVQKPTYKGNVVFLQNWLRTRMWWINANL